MPALDLVDGLREHAPDLWAHRRDVIWMLSAEDFAVRVPPFSGETEAAEVKRLWTRLAEVDGQRDPQTRAAIVRNLLLHAGRAVSPDQAQRLVDVAFRSEPGWLGVSWFVIGALGGIAQVEQAHVLLSASGPELEWHTRGYVQVVLDQHRRALRDVVDLVPALESGLPARPVPSNLAALLQARRTRAFTGLSLPGPARKTLAEFQDALSSLPPGSTKAGGLFRAFEQSAAIASLEGRPLDALRDLGEARANAAAGGIAQGRAVTSVPFARLLARLGQPQLGLDTLLADLTDPEHPTWLVTPELLHTAHDLAVRVDRLADLRAATQAWLDRTPSRRGLPGLAVASALRLMEQAAEADALLLDLVEQGPGLPATRALELLCDAAVDVGDLERAAQLALGTLPWILGWAGTIWKVEAHLRLARVRRLAGHPASAAASLERARQVLALDPVDLQPADSWLALAREQRDQSEDPTPAGRALREALAQVRARGLRTHELELLLDLAELPTSDESRQAEATEALTLATELGLPLDQARVRLALADLALRQGRVSSVQSPLEQANWWIQRIGDAASRLRCHDLRTRLAGVT
ncbi:hypothetical protein L6R53_03840 [Myxococcota bacterium]|nr:hypothetical protein [Myxococcota bacterium]